MLAYDYDNILQEAVVRSRYDPQFFAESILNLKLDPWQMDVLEAVCDVERKLKGMKTVVNHKGLNKITIRSLHGPGKTFIAALLMHWWNFTRYGRIVATAPKEGQLKTRLFPEFLKIGSKAVSGYSGLYKADSLKVIWLKDKQYFAVGETARDPENIAGYHHNYLLAIVDEASGVKENLFPALEGALSTHGQRRKVADPDFISAPDICIMILISNPTKMVGTFFASHMRQAVAQDYWRMHVDPTKSSRISQKWLDSMAKKYGRNSAIYKIRCLGEFSESDPYQLIPLQLIENARNSVFTIDGSQPKIRVSIDVSDGGEDETVVQGTKIYDSLDYFVKQTIHSFPKVGANRKAALSAEDMFERLEGSTERGDDIVVDSLGVGAGVRDNLILAGYNVVPFKGGSQASNPKRWKNRRTQAYFGLYRAFDDRRVVYADDFYDDLEYWDDYEGQLCSINRLPRNEKMEEIEPKQKLLLDGHPSPDRADASMMTYATQQAYNKQNLEGFGVGGRSAFA